jgi:DNA gyrase subunit A
MVHYEDDIMLITSSGVIIRFHVSDVSTIGRATRGVILMKTSDDNLIVGCAKTTREEENDDEAAEAVEVTEGEVDGDSDDSDNDENGPDTDAGQEILEKLGLDE